MNYKLIADAREAIMKGEKNVDDYFINVSKVDMDVKLSDEEKREWLETRKTILEGYYTFIVIDSIIHESDRGFHLVVNYLSKYKISEYKQNFIQLILSDDIIRYKINARRIERGISFEKANILFSRILHRYPHEESRLKVALERIVGEIK